MLKERQLKLSWVHIEGRVIWIVDTDMTYWKQQELRNAANNIHNEFVQINNGTEIQIASEETKFNYS